MEDHSICTAASIGRIQPELYKQIPQEAEESSKNGAAKTCGKINFSLKYDYEGELLLVTILKALDLPAKDLCGSSDPYVKIYLLPDRKHKFQTRVHRKTLNPTFEETFQFPVPYEQLTTRKLHLSVFDFDRFSRHDMIGEVILENLFEMSDLSRDTSIWRDIQYATSESVDLGEIMFSLCYLPTAGRLTLTVIKCRNLKAMDITGYSDPYVKVSLICDGKRLKKKKTTIKKNTLNPTYNEAIIFDIPPENMEQVSLHISVMDYDLGTGRRWDKPLDRRRDKRLNRKLDQGTVKRLDKRLNRRTGRRLDNRLKRKLDRGTGKRLNRKLDGTNDWTGNGTNDWAGNRTNDWAGNRTNDWAGDTTGERTGDRAGVSIGVGHNEVIGVNRVGSHAEGLGRDHWNEMLAYPRKPIAHWHPLLEPKKSEKEWKTRTASFDSQGSCPSPRLPSSP
ncbi:hypothetical protein NFI96_009759 [Prochilodus magdalenae]|nr:hypothetical protein NFI96_009759 [Prochilodus magdalenae]